CLNGDTGELSHHHFYDLTELLNAGDALIINDSRVLPARLYGKKSESGGGIEVLLLEQKEKDVWEVLVRPGKKAKTGASFVFGDGALKGEVLQTVEGGNRLMRFTYAEGENFYSILEQIGQMPLPPYITEKLKDKERYQTVYSHEIGSAAAPTAGLHFTKEMLMQLKIKGIKIACVTLHVGLGTFRPVKVDDLTNHHMHSEHYHLPQETVDVIKKAQAGGHRVIGVGTTVCRTLESVAAKHSGLCADDGYTDIFIYPGYDFKVLDCLV
ncbi:MAG: tRNA preQ1(34) S-adenosylmethionine ribosyltransferase-isomerase QueA, partial [Hydrogenoanaerobacterium sp.]